MDNISNKFKISTDQVQRSVASTISILGTQGVKDKRINVLEATNKTMQANEEIKPGIESLITILVYYQKARAEFSFERTVEALTALYRLNLQKDLQ